jgi:putative hemolysin secretion transport system ATP-binding protein
MLRRFCYISREGVNLLAIKKTAESIGFRTVGMKLTFKQLVEKNDFPCILYWNQNHFVVCYDITKKTPNKYKIKISDPASQRLTYTKEEFLHCWGEKS